MPTLLAINTWSSTSSNEKPREQRFYLNPSQTATQRDFNENPIKDWEYVGNIVRPCDPNRMAFLDNTIPKDIADDIRNNQVTHGTIWRF